MTLTAAAGRVFARLPEAQCPDVQARRQGELGSALILIGALMGMDHPLRAPVISIAGGLVGGFLVAATTRRACAR